MPYTMKIEPANALRSGTATWARIIGTNGRAVADLSVSEKSGSGYLAMNTYRFMAGGPVTIFARMTIFSQRRRRDDEEN